MLSKIRGLLSPAQRKSTLVLFCFMIVGMLLETLGIGLVVPAITIMMQDNLATRYPHLKPVLSWLGNPAQAKLISGAMLGLVGIYLVKNLFLGFLAWRQTRFAYDVQVQLSQRLFTTYLRQPYTFHLQRNSAGLIRNVTGEVGIFTGAISSILILFSESLIMIGIATLLLAIEPIGALIVAFVLGFSAWAFNRSTRARILHWGKMRQHHDGLRIQHLQQGLGGAKDVKLLGREEDFLAQYSEHNIQGARVAQFQAALQLVPRLWLELLAVTGLAILVLTMLAQGREMVNIIPTLGLFALAAFRLMPSVNRILVASQSLRYAHVVINTLHEEFKLTAPAPNEEMKKNVIGTTPAFQNEIRLSNVNYSYPAAAGNALESLSVVIKKGESVGFIGLSGSGKSTLVDVMLGLLPPSTGKVMVDGQDIQMDLRAWQNQIGYVPQTIYLTDDTLRRNIAFGLPSEQIDDDAVRRAIKDAQLEEFVASLPGGIESKVGERGIKLSGGQRQRIGIARALYHDPAVLVLDEATSALDADTERGVMQAVATLQESKTILIVAHRLSTIEHCNRLYRLKQGKIVAEGPPQKILTIKTIA